MITLTMQMKHTTKGWIDSTIVVVLNPSLLVEETAALVSELPEGIAARVKIDNSGIVSYDWKR